MMPEMLKHDRHFWPAVSLFTLIGHMRPKSLPELLACCDWTAQEAGNPHCDILAHQLRHETHIIKLSLFVAILFSNT